MHITNFMGNEKISMSRINPRRKKTNHKTDTVHLTNPFPLSKDQMMKNKEEIKF